MWIDYGAGLSQPDAFDTALALRKDELRGVKIRNCLAVRPRAVLEADPEGEHFCWVSLHFTGYDRKKHDAGIANYLPVHLGVCPSNRSAKLLVGKFSRISGHGEDLS